MACRRQLETPCHVLAGHRPDDHVEQQLQIDSGPRADPARPSQRRDWAHRQTESCRRGGPRFPTVGVRTARSRRRAPESSRRCRSRSRAVSCRMRAPRNPRPCCLPVCGIDPKGCWSVRRPGCRPASHSARRGCSSSPTGTPPRRRRSRDRAVLRRPVVLQRLDARGLGEPGDERRLLQRHWQPQERPPLTRSPRLVGASCRFECPLPRGHHDRVQRRIVGVDLPQMDLDELDRADLTRVERRQHLGRGAEWSDCRSHVRGSGAPGRTPGGSRCTGAPPRHRRAGTCGRSRP